MTKFEYLRIGRILRPHGVKGTLKIESLTFDNSRFGVLSEAFIEKDGTYTPVKVLSASYSDTAVYVDIEGVSDRDAAEKLRNLFLCVDRAHTAKLPEGQYFIADLIGCAVRDTEGKELGILSDVMTRPANDVYEIKSKEYTLYVPALKKLLTSVDTDAKLVVLESAVLEEVALYEYKDGRKDEV